jgi:hypothetical protein
VSLTVGAGRAVCAAGYVGVLCGACATGYQLESDGACTACGTMTWVAPAVISGALIIGVFVATQIQRWFDGFAWLEGLLSLVQELHRPRPPGAVKRP